VGTCGIERVQGEGIKGYRLYKMGDRRVGGWEGWGKVGVEEEQGGGVKEWGYEIASEEGSGGHEGGWAGWGWAEMGMRMAEAG